MAKKKSNKKTSQAPKTQKRLKDTEQVKQRKSTTGFGSAVQSVYKPVEKHTLTQIRELILTTVWAQTCIDTIIDEVVKYPLYTDPSNAEIDAFLKVPSEREPLFQIRKKALKDMLRWGNGAVVVEYEDGRPSGLNVAPGYTLRITDEEPPKYKFAKLSSYGNVSDKEFKRNSNGEVIELTGKELMHFQIDADSDSTLARSSIDRAFDDITSDKETQKKLVEHVSRGFYKPFFISFTSKSSVSSKELEEFVEYLDSLIKQGAKALGVNKEINFHEMPYWSVDDIVKMQQWIGLKVAAVFKVPPFMVNLVNDVGSLNAREQKGRFLENVVMPILEYEAFMYTMVLARKGFKTTETEITSNILGTKLNWNRARIAKMLTSPNQGILTPNELRKMFFNLPPVKGGDKLLDSSGNVIGDVEKDQVDEE